MWEYIAAGVPVAAMNADACAEFITSEGVGIAVDDAEDLAWRWAEHADCRRNIIKKRMSWCMDNHIDKLKELYQEVISG
jgi:glycosyltransferase involved in cell wall biosynthesis